MSLLRLLHVALCLAPLSYATNVYPSSDPRYDDMEQLYTVAQGMGSPGFVTEIVPCGTPPFHLDNSGRQTVGEWIRTAFHDMATYDHTTGLGGLDASILLERDRVENDVLDIVDSTGVLDVHLGSYRSNADIIALAVVVGVKSCRGPTIPMRVGRIDATSPGPSGVPQPDQTLATHTDMFKRMGFTKTEMITLVACGHTFGGVHQVDFPTVVPASEVTDNNTDGVQKFANSPTYNNFDNHLAVEWVYGNTTNPLVTSFNETVRSDARIFSADKNVTMKALAKSPSLFTSQCSSLFERMINTVPKNVSLSSPIVPYPGRPLDLRLTLLNQTTLHLEGYFRMFSSDESTFGEGITVNASMSWKNSLGRVCSGSNCTVPMVYDPTNPSTSFFGSAAVVAANYSIATNAGISSFDVRYTTSTKPKTVVVVDNVGHGFPMQDYVIWQYPQSCKNGQRVEFVVAIRNDRGNITNPLLKYDYISNSGSEGIVSVQQSLVSAPGASPSSYYTFYNTTILDNVNSASFEVSASVGGKKYSQLVDSLSTGFRFCTS